MNDELCQRALEAGETNELLEMILATIGLAVAVIDRRERVQIWNGRASELWGLGPGDVAGQPLRGLDIGLPVEQLREPIRACLGGGTRREELTLKALDRRGRTFDCRVVCLPVASARNHGGVTGSP